MPHAAKFRVVAAALLLLALSLSLKAVAFGREPVIDNARLASDLSLELTRLGYRTAVEQRPRFPPIITAVKADCLIKVRDSTFVGQEMMEGNRLRLARIGPVHTLYRGRYRPRYPRVIPELAWRVQRELARIGFRTSIGPVLSIAAPARCLPPVSLGTSVRVHVR